MTKKSFRPQRVEPAAYPRLIDLAPSLLRRWGLVALGGLLIGMPACDRRGPTSGEQVAPRNDRILVPQVRPTPGIDAGEAVPPTALPPPGEPPMDRVDHAGADGSGHAKKGKHGRHAGKGEVPPRLKAK